MDDGMQPTQDSSTTPLQSDNDALLRPAPPAPTTPDELERQARATMRAVLETGALGERMRRALQRTATIWNEAGPGAPEASHVTPEQDQQARALARRWKMIDFLIDSDLPQGMSVTRFQTSGMWLLEVRERGETRTLAESSEPYQGVQPGAVRPVLPVWDYQYPAIPEIESGERRERLPDSGMIGACLTCNGTGHTACRSCDGKGFVSCPICHGRAKTQCRRCRGRGQLPDPVAERRARSSRSYWQVRAERFAADAAGRLSDLNERLRQDYGVPLPPSGDWVPSMSASGEMIPCPDCVDGMVKCSCGNGKLVCETCRGSATVACAACSGSGRVVRYRDLVRRFDTRLSSRLSPPDDPEFAELLTESMVRRTTGTLAWEGGESQLATDAPGGIPPAVWSLARDLAESSKRQSAATADEGDRHVLSRDVRLSQVPMTLVGYTFAGVPYTFLAVGAPESERFWAESYPPRWNRVGRFFRALARDLRDDTPAHPLRGAPDVTLLDEYRARRGAASHEARRVPIVTQDDSPAPETRPASETPQVEPGGVIDQL